MRATTLYIARSAADLARMPLDDRKGLLVVPISDVIQPTVSDESGNWLGVPQIPRVGEVEKTYLTERVARLAPASVELVDMSLRVALDL